MNEEPVLKPINPSDPDVRKLAMIELARQHGVSWPMIARALGVPGKYEAKKIRRELGRRIRLRQMLG